MELGGEMPVEYPLRYGAIQQIVAEKGRGEAHVECFEEYLVEYGQEKIEAFKEIHDLE